MLHRAATLATLVLLLPASASADSARFAPVDVPTTDLSDAIGLPVTAAGGHVVFARAVDGVSQLVDWSAAAGVRPLDTGTRFIPADLDAGVDAKGRPVVVFSTCTKTGGHRCSLHVLRLDQPDARPTSLRLRGASGLSLTRPSMHGHAVAAVAAPRAGSRNVRILYWRTPTVAPRRLSGGTAGCPSYARCKGGPRTTVEALDLGRRSVAFVWDVDPGDSGTDSNQELRTAPLNGRRSRQAARAQGYTSGACGYRAPESPNALADGGVGFVLWQSPCTADETTIARWSGGARDFEGARPKGTLVRAAAWDGSRVYWLSCAPKQDPDTEADVIGDDCRLLVSSPVPFAPANLAAHG